MVAEAGKFAESWWPVAWPMLAALAFGVSGVWTWTVRKRHPRISRAIRWGLSLYLLAGALGWGLFLSSVEGPRHPEWFGWGAGDAGEAASP